MKKIAVGFLFSAVFCIVMFAAGCASMRAVPMADTIVTYGDFEFKASTSMQGKAYKVTWTLVKYNGAESRVTMPDKVMGYPVTSIADGVFSEKTSLIQVSLPRYLENMGKDVFLKCGNLKAFSISQKNANYKIIDGDLYDMRTKKMVWYPEGQKYFQYNIIKQENSSYVIITGAGSVKRKVSIPEQLEGYRVTEIAGGAFQNNSLIEEFSLGSSVQKIGDNAFAFSKKLSTVEFNSNITIIPYRAFYECVSLKEVIISDSVITISPNAFSDCAALKNVTLGKNVKTIGDSAFSACASIKEISITEKIENIASNAFSGASSLVNIFVDNNNKNYTDINGVLYDKNVVTIIRYPEGKTEKEYTVKEGITTIGESAFSFSSNLRRVVMANSVLSIENRAFFCCTYLSEVQFSRNTHKIGDDAFSLCISLLEINLNPALGVIGKRAFATCHLLINVRIPRSVVKVEEDAFRACDNLKEVFVSKTTTLDESAFSQTRAKINYEN